MKPIALIVAAILATTSLPAFAQSGSQSVRVQPGFFCAQNRCVRFSGDLSRVSVQARRSVSVARYNLRSNPVISASTYREIYLLALRQTGVNGNR